MDTLSLLARYDRRLPRYTSYPTAVQFDARVNRDVHRRWLAAIPDGATASLYLHVPFCRSLCWFCGCNTSVMNSVTALERYATSVQAEIARVASAIGHRLPVRQIHWGGGTPTALPAPSMQAIDAALRRHFTINADTEIAIEIDPRTLPTTAESDLRALGIDRASLGVQDFSPAVQDAIGRHQSVAQTRHAALVARVAGACSINLDLVYGLPHQTVASLEATVESVLEIDPDRVALYGYAHVPWMQKRQQVIAEYDLPDAVARLAQQARAGTMLAEAGYSRIGLDHFAKPSDRMALACGTPALRRNFQGYTVDDADVLIGFGASAISALPQGYAQNATRTADYLASIEKAGFAIARGLALTEEDGLRRAIIERIMCDLAVDVARLAKNAGVDFATFDDVWPKLESLAMDGLIRRDGSVISVTEAGRPFLRHVASCFDAYLDPETARHASAI
ncbi:oxygen-independent coproporphyrinogen III oxidase [Acidiphilium sp. AL]|uniref:oxygen-independent coproporphyrinogen III oxidase n=1 Tax=Acidiphilium sp. AL TaxID=2871704 RepID=UPI0021CAF40B|nr:oxygen-independent coproporphyrinogen III oxidase [Acidiphilium sp. AL]MCU4161929.1 oxygen-independent coproporphyrinogen III oxidase [Acidiphilium sp. AL]